MLRKTSEILKNLSMDLKNRKETQNKDRTLIKSFIIKPCLLKVILNLFKNNSSFLGIGN